MIVDRLIGLASQAAALRSAIRLIQQDQLAYIRTYGPPEMRDLEEADRWYARSAAAGCPQGHLGHALSLARRAADESERRQVAQELRAAADAGVPTALYLLGVLSENGT